jgi:hypothetical protein
MVKNLVELPPAEKKAAFEAMPEDFKEILRSLTKAFGKPESVEFEWRKEND